MTIEQNRAQSPAKEAHIPAGQIDLLSEISSLSEPITAFWRKRDLGGPRRALAHDEHAEFIRMNEPRNQKVIDLLLARNANDWSNIMVVLNRGIQGAESIKENIHPFSDNSVTIYAPSSKKSDTDFRIKAKLSTLRRAGLIDNSIDAEKLLGEKTENPDLPDNFVFRTKRELEEIGNLIYKLGKTNNPRAVKIVNYLDGLKADIIIDRFVGLKQRGKIPQGFNVSFVMRSTRNPEKPHIEITTLDLPKGGFRSFEIPGDRIGTALRKIGADYDYQ